MTPGQTGPLHFYNSMLIDVGRDLHVTENHYNVLSRDSRVGVLSRTFYPWVALSASYDAAERRPCLPGTRKQILKTIEEWADTGKTKVCWLHGPAGSGKTAIAQTICEMYAERKLLAASFFFSRSGAAERNSMKYLFPTIAMHITTSIPHTRENFERILDQDPLIATKNEGPARFIPALFATSDNETSWPSLWLVVIDGLDECEGNDDQRLIVQLIHKMLQRADLPLQFLIVSRPEPGIKFMFSGDGIMANMADSVSLYGEARAQDDVHNYLRNEFSRIHDSDKHTDIMEHVPRPWPSDDILRLLTRKSGGYFIYASTIIKYIDEEGFSCLERLENVLGLSSESTMPFAELDKLYSQILSSSRNLERLKRILGFVLFPRLLSEFPTSKIEKIFQLRPGEVMRMLRGLHSILSFKPAGPEGSYFATVHASFGDFLADKSRSTAVYYIDQFQWQEDTFRDILSTISEFRLASQFSLVTSSMVERLVSEIVSARFKENVHLERLIQIIHESLLENDSGWATCILQSEHLPDKTKYRILHFLTEIVHTLQRDTTAVPKFHLLYTVIDQLNSHCDLFFRASLSTFCSRSPSSSSVTGFLKDIHTMIPRIDGPWDWMEGEWQRLLHVPENLLPLCRAFVKFEEELSEIRTCYLNFNDFMVRERRSGDLHCAPRNGNARLAAVCIRQMSTFSPDEPGHYEMQNWLHHLRHAAPGDEMILPYFQDLRSELVSVKHEAMTIVAWLQSAKSNLKETVDSIARWKAHASALNNPTPASLDDELNLERARARFSVAPIAPLKFEAWGSRADVYFGYLDGQKVVVKFLRHTSEHTNSDVNLTRFTRELVLLSHLSHQSIAPFHGILEGSQDIWPYATPGIVMSYVEHPLMDYVTAHPESKGRLIHEIAAGIEYFHSKRVVHGDIKTDNVRVAKCGRAKIIDFNWGRFVHKRGLTTQLVPNPWYFPPETLIGSAAPLSFKTDVYQFAMLMLQVLDDPDLDDGKTFDRSVPLDQLRRNSLKTQIRLTVNDAIQGNRPRKENHSRITDEQWELLEHCWHQDPWRRPRMTELLRRLPTQ